MTWVPELPWAVRLTYSGTPSPAPLSHSLPKQETSELNKKKKMFYVCSTHQSPGGQFHCLFMLKETGLKLLYNILAKAKGCLRPCLACTSPKEKAYYTNSWMRIERKNRKQHAREQNDLHHVFFKPSSFSYPLRSSFKAYNMYTVDTSSMPFLPDITTCHQWFLSFVIVQSISLLFKSHIDQI